MEMCPYWKRKGVWPLAVAALLMIAVISAIAAIAPIYPVASNSKTYKNKNVTVDASHADLGYVMIKHKGSKKKVKVQITYDGETLGTYTLNTNNEFSVFPLVKGSGKYRITVLENVSTKTSSNNYTQLLSETVKADMQDPNSAFVTPNIYSDYNENSQAVLKANELCQGLSDDKEKISAIWDYLKNNMVYDYIKAATVKTGYVPVVDDALNSRKGICFDYAALFGAMLRSQGIPTQVVFGNLNVAGNAQRHAWNQVLVDGQWKLMDATFAQQGYSDSSYSATEVN